MKVGKHVRSDVLCRLRIFAIKYTETHIMNSQWLSIVLILGLLTTLSLTIVHDLLRHLVYLLPRPLTVLTRRLDVLAQEPHRAQSHALDLVSPFVVNTQIEAAGAGSER